jgi:Cysteine-rich secretory protein family
VPPLVWDDGLAAEAQARANVIAPNDAPLDTLHDPNAGAGENLWDIGVFDVPDAYAHAARDWLDEKSKWNQANPFDGNLDAGHYTQVRKLSLKSGDFESRLPAEWLIDSSIVYLGKNNESRHGKSW